MIHFTALEVILPFLKLGVGRDTHSLFTMCPLFAHMLFSFHKKIPVPGRTEITEWHCLSYCGTILRVKLAFCRIDKEAITICFYNKRYFLKGYRYTGINKNISVNSRQIIITCAKMSYC